LRLHLFFCVGVGFGWLVVPPAFRHPISAVFSSLSAIPSFLMLFFVHIDIAAN